MLENPWALYLVALLSLMAFLLLFFVCIGLYLAIKKDKQLEDELYNLRSGSFTDGSRNCLSLLATWETCDGEKKQETLMPHENHNNPFIFDISTQANSLRVLIEGAVTYLIHQTAPGHWSSDCGGVTIEPQS